MKKIFCTLLLGVSFLSLCPLSVYGQSAPISIPYEMSFEESDSVELANWVINPGVNASACKEQWVVGGATATDGRRALYISADNGDTDHFTAATNVQYAYRDVVLPAGSYCLTFDWRCMGSPNSSLYVCTAPKSQVNTLQADILTSSINERVLSWAKSFNPTAEGGRFVGSSQWRNYSSRFSSNGKTEIRIVFAWSNSNKDTTFAMPIAACIDNIQITPANCAQPTSLEATATCDTVILTWEGLSEKYEVEYRRTGTEKWHIQTNIYQSESQYNTLILEGMDEGVYDFRVRGVCNDTLYSAYRYLNSFVLFCPDNHCLNYADLENPNITCYYGTYQNPYMAVGVIDHGANSKDSRHTVNKDLSAYDPRTNNQLPLVPEGEFISIRLGNWNINQQAEAIEFDYVVDAETAAILLLRYAVVLEDPGHATSEPQFRLEILDEYGSLIDPTCGVADFTYSQGVAAGWKRTNDVAWKPWTTIGLNLEEYDGQMLKIRLTSMDCGLGAHYGYAYFTIGCADARIYGTSCGNEAQMSIEAPDGFDYEWYNKYDSLVATTQQLSVNPDDTTTYRCHLSYKEEKTCGFDLYSSASPRFPIADFAYKYAPADCRNIVRFTNKSHIFTMFDSVPEHHYDQECDAYEWVFSGDNLSSSIQSTDKNPIVTFPSEGGTYTATLFSSIAEGACVEDTTFTITIPAIYDTDEAKDTTICEGSYFSWDKYVIAEAGEFVAENKSMAGCDSTVTMHVTLAPQSSTYLGDTTVCAEIPLCEGDDCYKLRESGLWVRFFTNQYGCDSTITMQVTMQDSILPTIVVNDVTDEVASGSIHLGGTGYDYYLLDGEKNAPLDKLNGGIYNLEFFNDFGCSIDTTIVMNFSCLQVQLEEPLFACTDDDKWLVPFVVDSGVPTTYSLAFDTEALAQGFQNVDSLKMPTEYFEIPISPTAVPGIYHVQLILHDVLCEDVVVDLTLPLHYSQDVIFQRWDDVLSIRNVNPQNGDTIVGEFIAFQWMKNGEVIEGATQSYYVAGDGLDTEATYTCVFTLQDSIQLTTCGFTPEPYIKGVTVQPTQAHTQQTLQIISPTAGAVACYSSTGLLISSGDIEAGTNSFEAPAMQGVYILRVAVEGEVETFRITVSDK